MKAFMLCFIAITAVSAHAESRILEPASLATPPSLTPGVTLITLGGVTQTVGALAILYPVYAGIESIGWVAGYFVAVVVIPVGFVMALVGVVVLADALSVRKELRQHSAVPPIAFSPQYSPWGGMTLATF